MPFAYATFTNILALTNPETKCQYYLSELTDDGDFTQPVIMKGLVICFLNPKDKGKDKTVTMLDTEDNSMAVDPDLIIPSEGDVNVDSELIDFPESPKDLTEKKNA
ncbi:hypothetical protein C0995_015580 [Termitomyces sp. Mi166|nr:hypothetical protein C0995_015580 [Termitomyces sp. Mi166\